jgi:hypothetical protein
MANRLFASFHFMCFLFFLFFFRANTKDPNQASFPFCAGNKSQVRNVEGERRQKGMEQGQGQGQQPSQKEDDENYPAAEDEHHPMCPPPSSFHRINHLQFFVPSFIFF